VYDSIKSFVDTVNGFYQDKRIDFFVRRGLQIVTTEGESLSPTSLSSGERQLLLLFSNLLLATKRNSIFIVDEPELSLNVKWQRQLIKHLFDLTRTTAVQFVFATHSIELLSRHKEDVVRLSTTPRPSL
jgi:ABC-type glutathione transport system ATPase component